jgi:hypothetical protein
MPALECILRSIPSLRIASLTSSASPARTAHSGTVPAYAGDGTTVARRKTPGTIVTGEVLARPVPQWFEQSWGGRPLRLMGLGVSNFVSASDGPLRHILLVRMHRAWLGLADLRLVEADAHHHH